MCLAQETCMLFLINDEGEADESPGVLRGKTVGNRATRRGEGKICPHPFLFALTHHRNADEQGVSGKG